MTRQWGYGGPVLTKKVKATAMKVPSLWYQKINVDCIQEDEMYIINTNCETEGFWLNPIAKWYSQQKDTSRLTYEIEVLSQLVR